MARNINPRIAPFDQDTADRLLDAVHAHAYRDQVRGVYASGAMTAGAFADLDSWLRTGGALPRAWSGQPKRETFTQRWARAHEAGAHSAFPFTSDELTRLERTAHATHASDDAYMDAAYSGNWDLENGYWPDDGRF